MNFIPTPLFHPSIGIPSVLTALLLISWALWETVLRDHLIPRVKYNLGLRKFKKLRKRNLKDLRKYALQDLTETIQIYRRARHVKERRSRNRVPRHSAAITS